MGVEGDGAGDVNEADVGAPCLRARLAAAWRRLRGGELTATRAALSVAVGLAIGVTPLWGLHMILVLAVCLPLKLDAPVAYLAANISIPPLAPLLTMAELELGSLVLTGHALPTSVARLQASGPALFLKEIVAGTLVFSPAMALVGGALTFASVSLARGRGWGADPFEEAADRVAARYASRANRPAYYYVRGKLVGDPVARQVSELGAREPLGEVLDAGCGRGQLGVLLLEQKVATHVLGFDWDAAKVRAATAASEGLSASYRTHNLTQPLDAEADTVLLVDVLHYLSDEEQDAVIERAAKAARRLVVVRELDPDRGWRSVATRVQERVTTGLGYNRGVRVNARSIADLTRALEAHGFAAVVTPCWGSTPFANVLVVARRRA